MRILFGLVLLALALDALYFTGFYASDDIQYIDACVSIAKDGHMAPGFGNTRIGVTLPGAFVYWLTGSLSALVWFHVVYHLFLVPIAYVLARLVLDERAGLIAAALVAINPLFYGYAGAVLPDNSATCCFGLAMIALVATRRSADLGSGLLSWSTRRALGYFLAGAMIGLCYWCKESAIILTVPAAIMIMAAGPSLKSLVWVQNGALFALGLAVVFALELVVLRVVTGEWINRLTYLKDAAGELRQTMLEDGETPFARFAFASDQVTRWMPVSMWLLLAGTVAFGFTRARDAGLMALFWFPVIYMTIGSTNMSEYVPPPIQGRYYAIVVLPAIVMSAVCVSLLIQRWRTRSPRAYTGLALVASLLLVGVYECKGALPLSGAIYRSRDVRAFIAALERADQLYPDYPIRLSPFFSGRMGPVLLGREGLFREGAPPPKPPYVYIRGASETTAPDATKRATMVFTPPANRYRVLLESLGRLTNASHRKKKLVHTQYWSAELFVIAEEK